MHPHITETPLIHLVVIARPHSIMQDKPNISIPTTDNTQILNNDRTANTLCADGNDDPETGHYNFENNY